MLQQVLAGGARSALRPEREYCHYRESFEKFDAVFGRENVRLWKFEPAAFPAGCVVRDFCGRLGIDLPPERIRRVNESLSREALGLLLVHRMWGEDLGATSMSGAESRELARRLAGVGATKFRLSADIIVPVLEQHRIDIAWMEDRLGESLQEALGSHRSDDVRDESDLLRVQVETVQELLARLGNEAPAGVTGATLREVAVLVEALRQTGRAQSQASPGSGVMNHEAAGPGAATQEMLEMSIGELLELVAERNRIELGALPRSRGVAFIRAVLKHISTTLTRSSQGATDYAGLGQFRVRQVEQAPDGRSQITFRRHAQAKGKP
jgi:hypothetical protein